MSVHQLIGQAIIPAKQISCQKCEDGLYLSQTSSVKPFGFNFLKILHNAKLLKVLVLPKNKLKNKFHISVIGKSNGSVLFKDHKTNVTFTAHILSTSVLNLVVDETQNSVIVVHANAIISIPLLSIISVFSQLIKDKDIQKLQKDIGISFHSRPEQVDEFSGALSLDKDRTFFNLSIENAVMLSPFETICYEIQSSCFAVVGKSPFISFFDSYSRKSLSCMPEEFHVFKEKFKDVALFFGRHLKPYWTETKDGPCYYWPGKPNCILYKTYSLADMTRSTLPESFSISPDRRLATVTDNKARVTLVDLHTGTALRFWKGYRDAKTCFVIALERDAPAGRPARRGLFLFLYSPVSRILELWSLVHGPILKSWSLQAPLHFIPPHYTNYQKTFKRYSTVVVIDSKKLLGIRTNLDLWFPHTPEAVAFQRFKYLRTWISSRAFKRDLKPKFYNIISKLLTMFHEFSSPDWCLKAVWFILRSNNTDQQLLDWLQMKLLLWETTFSKVAESLVDKRRDYFNQHIHSIAKLIVLHRNLSQHSNVELEMEDGHREGDCVNEYISPVKHLPFEGKRPRSSFNAMRPSVFFRAVAFSPVFRTAENQCLSENKIIAHEVNLGLAIFSLYFQRSINLTQLASLLDASPISYDFALVIAIRCLLSVTQFQSLSLATQLTVDLLQLFELRLTSEGMKHLAGGIHRVLQLVLASRNYTASLIVCGAVCFFIDDSDDASRAKRSLSQEYKKTRRRIVNQFKLAAKFLQDVCIFQFFITSFASANGVPQSAISKPVFRDIIRKGSDYVTMAFAKCICISRLTAADVLTLYRNLCHQSISGDYSLSVRFQLVYNRFSHALEINRILILSAWNLSHQLAALEPTRPLLERFALLSRISDFLEKTSNAGHSLAYNVAFSFWSTTMPRLLIEYFASLIPEHYCGLPIDPIIYKTSLSLCSFFKIFQKLSLSANETSISTRDVDWQAGNCLELLVNLNSTDVKGEPTFPVSELPSSVTCSKLDAWLQFSLLHLALLCFGLPPRGSKKGDASHSLQLQPVRLLTSEHWAFCRCYLLPSWCYSSDEKETPVDRTNARRIFVEWFLRSVATAQIQDINGYFSKQHADIIQSAFDLAAAWQMPVITAQVFYVVTLYELGADSLGEKFLPAVEDKRTLSNSLFYVLAKRVLCMNIEATEFIRARASDELRVFLDYLRLDTISNSPLDCNTTSNVFISKLINLLLEHLPRGSSQRRMVLELRDHLQELN